MRGIKWYFRIRLIFKTAIFSATPSECASNGGFAKYAPDFHS